MFNLLASASVCERFTHTCICKKWQGILNIIFCTKKFCYEVTLLLAQYSQSNCRNFFPEVVPPASSNFSLFHVIGRNTNLVPSQIPQCPILIFCIHIQHSLKFVCTLGIYIVLICHSHLTYSRPFSQVRMMYILSFSTTIRRNFIPLAHFFFKN